MKNNVISSSGQSLVEYAVLITFVVCAIFMMSRYVIRSAGAGAKTWESQVNTSLHEPFKYLVPTLTYVPLRFHVHNGTVEIGDWTVWVPDDNEYCVGPHPPPNNPGDDLDRLSLGGWYSWADSKVMIVHATTFLRCASGGALGSGWPASALYRIEIYPPDSPNNSWPAMFLDYIPDEIGGSCTDFWQGPTKIKKVDTCLGNTFAIRSF